MNTPHTDIHLTCKCGEQFVWTLGEQRFMQKLLESGKVQQVATPTRCGECRKKKKLRYQN